MVSAPGTRSLPRLRSTRWRTGLRLIPLLCATWAGNAAALDVIFQGPPGSSGLTGAAPGAAGGNGQMAPLAEQLLFSGDPVNTLFVTGGQGGNGGNGAPGNAVVNGGNAGAGGAGANTSADLTTTLLSGPGSMIVFGAGGLGGNTGVPGAPGPGTVAGAGATGGAGGNVVANGTLDTASHALSQVVVTALGGQGGVGSPGMASGAGGGATSNARATSSGSGPLLLSSIATGGAGGAAGGESAFGGNGGAATATNGLNGAGAADLTMLTYATGGRGGDANLDITLMPHANGGHGGAASASITQANGAAYSGNTLTLSQTATGGAGGGTFFGTAGNGGNAWSVITLPLLVGAQSVSVSSTAIGGNGGEGLGSPFEPQPPEWGVRGAGGAATSEVSLTSSMPASGGWNAVIDASSTAIAGIPGNSPFVPSGGRAEASSIVHAYGQVTSVASAVGGRGGEEGGNGVALATAGSNYIAIARAGAIGGGSYVNPGAGAIVRAVATSGYFASADATATSGSGRFGSFSPSSALAEASVVRIPGDAAPPSPSQPSEARAHAWASAGGSDAEARSTYTDFGRDAAVTTRGVAVQPVGLYWPEAYTAANVGGAAYAAWQGPGPAFGSLVVSYASALPTAASVAPLIASSAEVSAAFAEAETLGAGTMAAMFFPFTGTAQFDLPFAAGSRLLLGLVQPYAPPFDTLDFTFSVSNGGVSLYSGSFLSAAQADGFFNGHVLDLGVINASALDLLITYTFRDGNYGFSYLIGQGGALAPIPEPGAWLLLLLGLALLAWRGAGATCSPRASISQPCNTVAK